MTEMELTKQDTQMAKGIAVLGMVMLHLFCRIEDLPYTPLIWVGSVPLIYYLGLFGDLCVPVFCFCSGYAHYLMAEAQKTEYAKRLPGKALRFLTNYWVVLILFSALGLVFDRSGTIPGDWRTFVGNLLLVGMNYNGAWWFVVIYLFLLMLSPAMAAMTRQVKWTYLLAGSFAAYFVAYILRFIHVLFFENPLIDWCWRQAVLFGTSQLPYLLGMVCRKYTLVSRMRRVCEQRSLLRRCIVFLLPLAAFVGHCVVQSVFVAPFTAVAVLAALFLAKLPEWVRRSFLLLGTHSTNIWLVHMFFYVTLFPGFAFRGKYTVFVLTLMMAACFASSVVIEMVYRRVLGLIGYGKQHL